MPMQNLAQDVLSSVAVWVPGRSLALLACSCRGMAVKVTPARLLTVQACPPVLAC